MPATYEPIATTTLGSAASTITFSSISGTYTDLRLVFVGTGTAGSDTKITFNGDGATNYSYTYLSGDGVNATSARNTSKPTILPDRYALSATIPSMYTIDIFSYAGSTYKTILTTASEDYNGSGAVTATVGLWRSTSAITQVTLTNGSGTYSTGTTATLYGIKSA